MDIDFQDNRREEVIDYVKRKYGEDCVSNIITFGNMKSKSAIRDVARILDFPPTFGDKIAKLVPDKVKNLSQALETSVEFRDLYDADKNVRKVVDTAIKVEGLPKSIGKHACFDENTLISTDNGLKRIIDIKIGDKVLTHNLRYKPVVDLIKTETDIVYVIGLEGLTPIRVTPNHPLYVKSSKEATPQWKAVGDINFITDYLAVPLNEMSKYTNTDINSLNTEDYFIDNQIIWIKLNSIEFEEVSQSMYNLTVLDDSSYIAGGIIAHNCGILISPKPITEFVPQVVVMDETGEKDEKGNKIYEEVKVTQVDMVECESLGMLKMDFLGLRNLAVIAGSLERINRRRVKEGLPTLTMDDIPINDPYAYAQIQSGKTVGVFQLESPGMTDLVSKTYLDIQKYIELYEGNKVLDDKGLGKFSNEFDALFERLIALISLYRPGPMDEIPNYLKNMSDPEHIIYDVPELEKILSNTYGVIVYQEQVMHAVRELAGFSAGQSDVIRKAMGKLFAPHISNNMMKIGL